ncbi:MAG: hydroxymethylbilane synthase [Burkholderiales bacterium]|jgi:hydroxymethylbilane synthase|nr:hydroxymethylbilane synthase [Burkholderiales bacterium]
MYKKIRIITRKSELALWQANFVKEELLRHHPGLQTEIIGVTTSGDKILDKTLDKVGGKGLFIKELESGLLADTADIAVHSLKDLPAALDPTFKLAAILKREDAADAFVSNKYSSLEAMPGGAVIGTSSARRVALLKQHYPQLQIKLLRGNVQTRLGKLDKEEYDAIILAVAGLKRLGLSDRITQKLDTNKFLPSIGQGALAIEVLSSGTDLIDYLKPLEDKETRFEVDIERMVGSRLGASCSVPIAVYAKSTDNQICLTACLWDVVDNRCSYSRVQLDKSKHEEMVNNCLEELYKNGAREIMAKYPTSHREEFEKFRGDQKIK